MKPEGSLGRERLKGKKKEQDSKRYLMNEGKQAVSRSGNKGGYAGRQASDKTDAGGNDLKNQISSYSGKSRMMHKA
jgi:hypothetical protein